MVNDLNEWSLVDVSNELRSALAWCLYLFVGGLNEHDIDSMC